MSRADIRIKANALIRRGRQILVHTIRDKFDSSIMVGYRIPGGHVEFGELAMDAVQREIHEELSVEIIPDKLFTVLENVYCWSGQAGHEIMFIYESRFVDETLYQRETFTAHEEADKNHAAFELFWVDPHHLPNGMDIFPAGLVQKLIEAQS